MSSAPSNIEILETSSSTSRSTPFLNSDRGIRISRVISLLLPIFVFLLFVSFSARQAARIPELTLTHQSIPKILWFVLEGDTSTLPALSREKMLVQRLPRITAASIKRLELLLSTIGDVSKVTYHLQLFDSANELLFSSVVNAGAVAPNAYHGINVDTPVRPLKDERVTLVFFSENATDDQAITAYFTRSHPKGAFFLVPFDGSSSVKDILANLPTNPAKKRFRGSINLNMFGN